MSLFEQKYPNNIRTIIGLINVPFQDDSVLECDTSLGVVGVQLISIPANFWSTQYKLYVVDKSNNASVNNITITAPVGFKINGASSVTIIANGGSYLIRVSSNTDYVCQYSAGSVGSCYNLIEDEGVPLVQRNILDFQGTGVTATDDGVSKTIVTIPSTIVGGFQTVSNLDKELFTVAPVGDRALGSGTIWSNAWLPTWNEYGTLVGTFNNLNGEWTCPTDAYYDITTMLVLSIDVAPFNALTSVSNPNGFISNGVNTYSANPLITPLNFNDYIGRMTIGIMDNALRRIYCVNTSIISYDTSVVNITASYTGVLITRGTILNCVYLYKGNWNVIGNLGNSFHFSVTQLTE